MIAWHVTTAENLMSIMQQGLVGPSYWSTDERLLDYYVETVREEGGEPCVLEIDASQLDEIWLEPDHEGIEEPIAFPLGTSDQEVWHRWKASGKRWRDSVGIIGSFRCRETLLPALLSQRLLGVGRRP